MKRRRGLWGKDIPREMKWYEQRLGGAGLSGELICSTTVHLAGGAEGWEGTGRR